MLGIALILGSCGTTPTPSPSSPPAPSPTVATASPPPTPSPLPPQTTAPPTTFPTGPPPPPQGDPCGTNGIFCGPYAWTATFNVPFTPTIDCATAHNCELQANVYQPVPKQDSPVAPDGGWPLIVAIPGGPAAPGARDGLSGLAAGLAVQGVVIVLADWREAPAFGGGYPRSFEDVSCAIRFARSNAVAYGADPSRVTLVAHSFGGFPAAVVALAPDVFPPDPTECLSASGSSRAEAYVGIAPISTLDMIGQDFLATFLGGTREDAPASWDASDPVVLASAKPAYRAPIQLVVGSGDSTVSGDQVQPLVEALTKAGRDVGLATVLGVGHQEVLTSPQTIALVLAMARR
jgi:acetyl esterase/lipase